MFMCNFLQMRQMQIIAHLCTTRASHTPLHNHSCHLKSCSRQQISNDFDISQLVAAKSCSICFLIKTWWLFYSNCLIIAKAISLMSILIRLHSVQLTLRHCSRAVGGHAPSVPRCTHFPRATFLWTRGSSLGLLLGFNDFLQCFFWAHNTKRALKQTRWCWKWRKVWLPESRGTREIMGLRRSRGLQTEWRKCQKT